MSSRNTPLTAEIIREILEYRPLDGVFYWRNEGRAGFNNSAIFHKAGDIAGTKRKVDGRVVIRINGKLYLRYRLAWLWVAGVWPLAEIDHIDGDPTNDRFSNLRDASRTKNQENMRLPQKTKESSAFLGVYANKKGRKKRWRSAISVAGKQISLGAFYNEIDAYEAYVHAKRNLHEGCTI